MDPETDEGPLGPDERGPILRTALSIGAAAATYGLSFGAASTAAGLSVAQTCVLSLAAFTGASQFALIGVLGAGGATATAVGTALLLGVRNGLYGLRLATLLGSSDRSPRGRARRLLAAHLVIDETTAVATAQERPAAARAAFWTTAACLFVLWNVATLVGALSAAAVADPRSLGLDAAFPAAFLALLAPLLRKRPEQVAALTAVGVVLVTTPFAPAGVPVLLASVGVLPALLTSAGRSRSAS